MNKWIKVSERLPDKSNRYLVYFDDKELHYAIGFSSFLTETNQFNHVGITHWMEPPDAPSE